MFVLTVDQQNSRRGADLVPGLLADIAPGLEGTGVVIPFDRTVGDEVQGVFDDAGTVVEVVLGLLRRGGWSVGLGIGDVDRPLPPTSREASGAAFVFAREAVERAKNRTRAVPIAVVGADPDRSGEVEALLSLLGAVIARRTDRGWAAVDALDRVGGRQKDVAQELGISEQAVSQRLRAALWSEEARVRPVAIRLLADADRDGRPPPGAAGSTNREVDR